MPDASGYAEHGGNKVYYEVFGAGEPTVVLVHGIPVVHSRVWKGNIPLLARHNRVVSVDLLGNGRSDRPVDPAAYSLPNTFATVLAVLAATDTDRRIVVGSSLGAVVALMDAAFHPDKVAGIVLLTPSAPVAAPPPGWDGLDITRFDEPADVGTVWGGVRRPWLREDYAGFAQFFMEQVTPEPHTASVRSDFLEYANDTTGAVIEACFDGLGTGGTWAERVERMRPLVEAVHCPSLVIHGTADRIAPVETAKALAEMIDGDLLLVEGGGHALAKAAVTVNIAVQGFVDQLTPRRRERRWSNATGRPRKALYLSSPIGLGHVHRDLAIARELRARDPELQIEWLAQPPVAGVLEEHDECLHPASRYLARELDAFEQGCEQHGLNAFQAFRRTDDVQLANFHVFNDVVADGGYDVVIADEAWEVDQLLHDNPELKSSPFVWLTDLVGVLAAPGVPERDLPLIYDANQQMIDHRSRYPWLRDISLFVGNPEDLLDVPLAPGGPTMRAWTAEHFGFTGYVLGAPPMSDSDKAHARQRFGFSDEERVCIVTAGGSAAGRDLLAKVAGAYPALKDTMPDLRMIVVTGPRIPAESIAAPPGVEVMAYLPQLSARLGAADMAVVQGGLASCMELTANRTPFVYVPLQHHFEQQINVPARLANYGAGRRLDWCDLDEASLAAALSSVADESQAWKPVETNGAARAADAITAVISGG